MQDVPPEAWSTVQNARFNELGATAFSGHQEVFSPASITPLWLKQFPPVTIPIWVYANTAEVWTYAGGSHVEITRAAGDYNGDTTERWMGNVFNGLGIFNNTVDPPQLWGPMSTATQLVDLTNWPASYKCKFIRPYKNFLIAGGIYDGANQLPFRLKWSHPAAPGTVPTSWDHTDPATDAGERDLAGTSDYLVDGLILDEIFVVYRQFSTWGMRYVGPPDFFSTWPISEEAGILARDCMQATPVGHIVLTRDDLVLHQGTGQSFASLLEHQDRKTLFGLLNGTYFYNSFLVKNVPQREIWACFPSVESVSGYANKAFVWSWAGGGHGFRDLPEVPFAYGGASGVVGGEEAWG